MKVLVVGNGGREHALAFKAAQSKAVETVYVAPGNAGSALEDKVKNIDIAVDDFDGLVGFAREHRIELTIVGPEVPLAAGIVDVFQQNQLRIFGPSRQAAQLEGSKVFAKDFLARHQIPTAAYASFTDVEQALQYLHQQSMPIVVKADGLAAGKGVVVAHKREEAATAIKQMLADNRFGHAGKRVVIEQFLEGEEASFIVMTDGEVIVPFATSQDHKRLGNGDTGPNTGGMGAYSPAPVVTPEIHGRIMREVIEPTVKGMAQEGTPYTGFLYAGLMIGADGSPKVIEYNCRFGDPETQAIVMRMQSDLVELCCAALDGKLAEKDIVFDTRAAVGVVMAAGGYPGGYLSGKVIRGLPKAASDTLKVFHAGTAQQGDVVVTSGGRVLCVTALGNSVTEAQQHAYQAVRDINWEDAYYREDIASKAIARESQ